MSLLITLLIVGILAISLEIFVPGGILGVIGTLSLVACVVLAFQREGVMVGMTFLLLSMVGALVSVVTLLKLLPKLPIGKKLMLDESIGAKAQYLPEEKNWVGAQGEALTVLAPTGMVKIEGQVVEAFSADGLIEKGTLVEVKSVDNFRIIVKAVKNK